MRRYFITGLLSCFLLLYSAQGQAEAEGREYPKTGPPPEEVSKKAGKKAKKRVFYGTASYYSHKFRGRKTASGATYRHRQYTAACNRVPLGTLVRVTNLKNKKSIVIRVNDRMSRRSRRVVDLSRACAVRLGFVKQGVTRVRVEVLRKPRQK
ncbi:septal ring lytic transglycosylase RlpA family protein [Paraflavisolibacter sp. H34]|uniref:septal ring lytic transglycosylase RlpA family protein n=1 Tax=Huijunlia imazamoxiresistens TaxID=3127457 RepID=UPI003019027A